MKLKLKLIVMRQTFKKGEKLKSKKLIEQLFERGKRLKSFPIQLVYLEIDHKSDFLIQAGFSVPKKRFKKAVDRNRIKRLMREAYRLHKHKLPNITDLDTKKHIFMFIYMGSQMENCTTIEAQFLIILKNIKQKLVKNLES